MSLTPERKQKNPKRVAPQILKQIEKQKKRVLVGIAVGLISMVFFIYLMIFERSENLPLKFFLAFFGGFAFYSSFKDYKILKLKKENFSQQKNDIKKLQNK